MGVSWAFGTREPLTVSPFPSPQLLEDLEEQLYCSAFEEAALTRRICSESWFSPDGMVGMAWAGPSGLGGSTIFSALRSHLLLAAFGYGAAAQTGPGSADTEGPAGYVGW